MPLYTKPIPLDIWRDNKRLSWNNNFSFPTWRKSKRRTHLFLLFSFFLYFVQHTAVTARLYRNTIARVKFITRRTVQTHIWKGFLNAFSTFLYNHRVLKHFNINIGTCKLLHQPIPTTTLGLSWRRYEKTIIYIWRMKISIFTRRLQNYILILTVRLSI